MKYLWWEQNLSDTLIYDYKRFFKTPCGGLYDICFDDVYQLSHVKDCWIFENLKYGISTLTLNEWKCLFQVHEFTEVMPQREDSEFIQYMDAYSNMDKI